MGDKDELAKRIGNRLKRIRTEAAWTLKKLAEATDLSSPLLSRIENGLLMPSIPTLQSIAKSLSVDITYFFKEEGSKSYVVSPRGKRRILPSKRGYEIELLVEGMPNAYMEPAIVTEPVREHQDEVEMAIHDGQEFMYVLEGSLKLTLGSERFILKKGDVAYWFGQVPHKGVSVDKKPSRTLNVHLIPGKRVGTF